MINTTNTSNLDAAITEAGQCINYLYPLTNFIACNALKGWENTPFTAAMRASSELFGAKGFLPLAEYRAMYESGRIEFRDLEEAFRRRNHRNEKVQKGIEKVLTLAEMLDLKSGSAIVETINKQLVKWCGAYLDETQAQWKPYPRKGSLYSYWKDLARYDMSMPIHGVKKWSHTLEALPASSSESLAGFFMELDIPDEKIAAYLRRHISQMPGFASYLKWHQAETGNDVLADYLAIRLYYEKVLGQVAALKQYRCTDLALVRSLLEADTKSSITENAENQSDYSPVWQEAYELNYRNRLLSALALEPTPIQDNACCQVIFCIDVRSEPIRRRLERIGPYSTYGFAGFFGMAMSLTELGSSFSLKLCPVLIKPEKEVLETAESHTAFNQMSWQALKATGLQLKKKLKCDLAATFGLVESIGLFSSIALLARTFAPAHANAVLRSLEQRFAPPSKSHIDSGCFSLEEKVAMAEGTIKGIGLAKFGKVIVFCGHKSSSVNNPFASALDCGACGGNGGAFSARLAAQILNDQAVRIGLSSKGIVIPNETIFVAAEHDTTTDEFAIFVEEELPEEHSVVLNALRRDLALAGDSLRNARAKKLPESCFNRLSDPKQRAYDWAQIAPEWGLAGNAAFVAAPRTMSKDADLEGRVFLHSYDYTLDKDGTVLELIMTAPLIVAQWINSQYYLSTTDNATFGSGSKVVHNVIGDFAVMQGAQSDLKMGLPLQSIMASGKRMHEPMRLLAVLRAPLRSIDQVLNKHPQVRGLVANRWLRLIAADPDTQAYYEAEDSGKWRPVEMEKSAKTDRMVAVPEKTPT